ncbi:phage terminase large subunit-like protein [Modicisalibacter xianhensis]|uniref:Phage terminase large subunit-like protein n=1 Tax=Modicisalibacter xianhensis TaxID=442341 RepID=A0A4R8FRC2_9GAMM|nr:terminase family protein [Halomonas xianhensis]TDX29109.1 phage terminase large subunit-like protein [Halomonas xianhensis]
MDDRARKLELLRLLEEKARRRKYNLIDSLFPEDGPFRRELYAKHMEFFRAGKLHRERLFMAGNRVGKTIAGGGEMTYHLTGNYPEWWDGHRIARPVTALAAGDTSQTTRDIIQSKLLGGLWDTEEFGTGLIPRALLGKPTPARGVANLYEEIRVKHASGGWSRLMLRSYDQGRRIFQGTEQDVVWLDEEVPKDVYDEALIRTMTTRGIVMMTFTPLSGLTELVVSFLEAKHQQEPV